MIDHSRVLPLKELPPTTGPVLCWLERDHRVQDNWALLYARELAANMTQPFGVVLSPYRARVGENRRQAAFLIEGWRLFAEELERLNIPLYVITEPVESALPALVDQLGCGVVVVDHSPLKPTKVRVERVADRLKVALYQVDAHNVVPVWVVSDKQEFSARTIRPKIHRLLGTYLTDMPRLGRQQREWPGEVPSPDWVAIEKILRPDFDSLGRTTFVAGHEAAVGRMETFLTRRLPRYGDKRNDPNEQVQSDLSPYLNAGQISAQRVALEAQRYDRESGSQEMFLEEVIVRRELSENFCFYNEQYDTAAGFPDWGSKTLREHQSDPRAFLYSREQWEAGETHDDTWNACQGELVTTGKLHGYMRMYWAKKLLEWSATPEDAFDTGVYLNDTYELDGNDPNGFAGVAWSIGGLHDRPWTERDVFGKIRYMNANGCRRKFDVDAYIRKHGHGALELFR